MPYPKDPSKIPFKVFIARPYISFSRSMELILIRAGNTSISFDWDEANHSLIIARGSSRSFGYSLLNSSGKLQSTIRIQPLLHDLTWNEPFGQNLDASWTGDPQDPSAWKEAVFIVPIPRYSLDQDGAREFRLKMRKVSPSIRRRSA